MGFIFLIFKAKKKNCCTKVTPVAVESRIKNKKKNTKHTQDKGILFKQIQPHALTDWQTVRQNKIHPVLVG